MFRIKNWVFATVQEINNYEHTINYLKNLNKSLTNQYNELLSKYEGEVKELRDKLRKKQEQLMLEEYWNNKRPKATVLYNGRYIPNHGKVKIDVRNFFTLQDSQIPIIKGENNDDIALKTLMFVHNKITYVSDKVNEGLLEYWQFPYETLKLRKGDCEDGAILLANILVKSGVPYWRVRLNAGNVKGGGHAYTTYLAEKDNKWYVLDWCYWYDESINNFGKKEFSRLEKYYNIWFSWNTKYAFYDMVFTDASNDKEHRGLFGDDLIIIPNYEETLVEMPLKRT